MHGMMRTNFCQVIYDPLEINSQSEFDPAIRSIKLIFKDYEEVYHFQFNCIPETIKTIASFNKLASFNLVKGVPSLTKHQLHLASELFDFIELPYNSSNFTELLALLSPQQRMLNWEGQYISEQHLDELVSKMLKIDAAYYFIEPTLNNVCEGYSLLKVARRQLAENLVIHGAGPSGLWTQIYQYYKGASMVFCHDAQYGQEYLTIEKWKKDYPRDAHKPIQTIYGIAGNPVYGSLSPRIHNRIYGDKGSDYLYLPFHIEQFEEFIQLLEDHQKDKEQEFTFGGFTIVSPFKEDCYNYAKQKVNPNTRLSRAANILINQEGDWVCSSSDGYGVLSILKKENLLEQDKTIAIIGCGGAGRTIAATLKNKGIHIHLFNRSVERGVFAADKLGIRYDSPDFFKAHQFDVVVNATPLGKQGEPPMVQLNNLHKDVIIIDLAYARQETPLVRKSRLRGIKTYSGKDILQYQVSKQIEVLTGIKVAAQEIEEMLFSEEELIVK